MAHLFKWLLSLLLLPLAIAFTIEAFVTIGEEVSPAEVVWLCVGFGGFVLLYPLSFNKNRLFAEHFEHELSHTALNLLWWRTLVEFRIHPYKENESYVRASPIPFGAWVMVLAPYYFPVFTIPFLIIRPFFDPLLQPMLDIFIGIALAFHYVTLFKEFSLRQTDIQAYTLPLSFVLTLLLNCLFTVLIIILVIERGSLLALYLERAYTRSAVYYDDSWFLLKELWDKFTRSHYR